MDMHLGILHGEGVVAATVGGGVEHGASNHVQHFESKFQTKRFLIFNQPFFSLFLTKKERSHTL